MKIYPISFSVPYEKIIDKVTPKTKLISGIIPGKFDTYIYTKEDEYYKQYQDSIFGLTIKKGGWDCMRHYEILANGCIPVFPNIEECPPNTMTFMPKDLLKEANKLYKESIQKPISEIDYLPLATKFLEYTKEHLTTKHMAEYVLKTTGHENAKKILFLSGNVNPDYLRCLTLHGFKTLFGENCHDYPKINHLYKSAALQHSLYGMGFTYGKLLEQNTHIYEWDKTIENDIKEQKYDIVIYGSFHRGMPYYDLVSSVYDPNKVILICGEDLHTCCFSDKHPVFIREL